MRKKIDKTCSLLPHIKENIYGLSPNSAQILGWEILKFNIPEIWKQSQGEGVKVAVIDTGCDINHPDLKNNILSGKNFLDSKKDPIDDHGHGTHVSGIISAENNKSGMVGISPKTKIIPVKALDASGNGAYPAIANAIVWSADQKADFITMSLGCPSDIKDIRDAIKYATKKGTVVFCAAGNSGPSSPIMYPARYSETVSIGSINQNLERSGFSCCGEELEFLCPGENILSCVPKNNYAIMSGTSMAAPFAVGAASLLLSFVRSKSISKVLNKQFYIDNFKKNCKNLSDKTMNSKKYQGYGILHPALTY